MAASDPLDEDFSRYGGPRRFRVNGAVYVPSVTPRGMPAFLNAPSKALTWGNVWWGRSGLNRRPTDYEMGAGPLGRCYGTPVERSEVRGCRSLGDLWAVALAVQPRVGLPAWKVGPTLRDLLDWRSEPSP